MKQHIDTLLKGYSGYLKFYLAIAVLSAASVLVNPEVPAGASGLYLAAAICVALSIHKEQSKGPGLLITAASAFVLAFAHLGLGHSAGIMVFGLIALFLVGWAGMVWERL